jgi:hypothetical protein
MPHSSKMQAKIKPAVLLANPAKLGDKTGFGIRVLGDVKCPSTELQAAWHYFLASVGGGD